MKFEIEGKREWITRGSVLAIAGFSIFVLVQNGCSNSVAQDGGDAGSDSALSGCFAGETLTKVGSQTLCCSGTPPTLVCHDEGGRIGDPCSASSFPASQLTVTVTLDVCIADSCDGNRTPTTYDGKTVATTTPLTCTNGALAANGDPTTQEVDRVCSDVAPLICAGTSYEYGYGYVTTYGYGYYGGSELMTRSVSVASSTCTTSNSAPTPCDVGQF
jgi:hypothetical protein